MPQATDRTGLFTGFEGYRSPTEHDFVLAVKQWLVVPDTNVLLSLYSYQGASLDEFIAVFEALDDRLFVPHQVIDEFWRNRRVVLSENQGHYHEHATVQKAFKDIDSAFRKWHQRVVDRTSPPPEDALRELNEARTAIAGYMAKRNEEAATTQPDTPTFDDRVLRKLEPILDGKVGPAPDKPTLETLRAEGKKRIAAKTPPGYMDAGKNPDRAIGDFLVWRQAMEASKARDLPVLLVTQDQKEDWWADRGTQSMRARPELVAELREYADQRLLMIRAFDLLKLGAHLGVSVSESTVDDAEKVGSDDGPAGPANASWTSAEVREAALNLANADQRDFVTTLLDASAQRGAQLKGGIGPVPSAGLYFPVAGKRQSVWSVWIRDKGADIAFNLGWLGRESDTTALAALELLQQSPSLNAGLTLPNAEMIKKNPKFPVGDLVDDPQALDAIIAAFDIVAASGP